LAYARSRRSTRIREAATRSPFEEALSALLSPLRFAAADDFARADRVRDLPGALRAAAERAQALRVPEDVRGRFERVAVLFSEDGAGEETARRIEAALEALEPLAEPGFARAALARSPASLPGVGPKRADALARRGVERIEDLLFHLPSRYDDRRSLVPVAALEVGRRASFTGEVLAADFAPSRGRRRLFQAIVGDETGTINLKWFRGAESMARSVRKGARFLVTGDVRRYRFSKEIVHPELERLGEGEDAQPAGRRVVADYPGIEGLAPRTVRHTIELAVERYADLVVGHLPSALVAERKLPGAAAALVEIHVPQESAAERLLERRTPGFERLILEELYLLELGLALRRAERAAEPGISLAVADAEASKMEAGLPFELTAAQRRAWGEIRADLARSHPMNRLLQGDVGSGKTAVAFLAGCLTARAGHQTALMAPTELLAEQHARTLGHLAAGVPGAPRIGLLTASVPRAEAAGVREALASGDLDIVVGTHALVQGEVRFARLGLAIVDEQHRFGVLQRAALAGKTQAAASPHVLVMTATPIPRTLALTAYGDLDLSVIDALPPGRQPVLTAVLRSGEGARVLTAIREALSRKEQVYVVYPLVEESEKSDLRAATEQAAKIAAALPEARIDLVHGRLDAAARAAAMARFAAGEIQVLVSTTVIEVGVDVANATLMVVDHAERFGLAQLHQLRGRVGRGDAPGSCLLIARGSTEDSEARLRAMLETTDGFRIADADLRIRGPGEFLGTRQHGRIPDLRLADLIRDARLVSVAREAALEAVRGDPGLRAAPDLARAVAEHWGDRLALIGVA